jgi:RIO-like serine/threonine protein kinase
METQAVTNQPIKEKWGDALRGGFVVVPATLLRNQHRLGIGGDELTVLINLFLHWWKADDLPYPTTTTIAKRMGVNRRTAQRHIESLIRKGLIRRVWRDQPRPSRRLKVASYDLSALSEKLKEFGRDYVLNEAAAPEIGRWPGVLDELL